MESLIHLIHQAVAAFKAKQYEQVVLLLNKAYDYVDAIAYTLMDAQIYNSFYDAYEMLSLITELGVFEKNAFLKHTLQNYHKALQAFTEEQGGTVAALQEATTPFIKLMAGMAIAVQYLIHNRWRITDFPPVISFEFTSKGQIKLYAWQAGTHSRVTTIEHLKNEFEQLFEQEQMSKSAFIEQLENMLAEQKYQDALKIIDLAIEQHPTLKSDWYIRKAEILIHLEDYEQVVDLLMKARVMGEPKHRIKTLAKTACQKLIQMAASNKERRKWSDFLYNFL